MKQEHTIYIVCGFLAFLLLILILYFFRKLIKGNRFSEKVNATGLVAIITGTNCGIGKELALELNLRHAKVYMLCRNVEKANEAYGCECSRLIVKKVDLCDFSTIKNFVNEFNSEEQKLDILINNAGVLSVPKFEKTVDGNEITLQSNYLGHFLLTELLLEKLEKSQVGGRIINVSSKLHKSADTVDLKFLNDPANFSGYFFLTYSRSKLALVMHAVALTNRIRAHNKASKLTINSCHPGVVDTSIVRNSCYTNIFKRICFPCVWFTFRTANDGAQTPLYLALSQKLNGISGRNLAQAPHHSFADDAEACNNLYNDSLALCGILESYY